MYNRQTTIIGYRDCLLGTGQQSPLLLQDGLRCVQVQPETKNSWDLAMDLCNSRQGHLVHIYTSEEAKLFNSWIIQVNSLVGKLRQNPKTNKFGQKHKHFENTS